MTDTAPAYATAVEQLRARAEAAEKERDDARAEWGNMQRLLLQNTAAQRQLGADADRLKARNKTLQTERDNLRAQLEAAQKERDTADATRALTPHDSLGADKWLPELNRAERERTDAQNRADAAERACDDLRAQLAAVTAERDEAIAAHADANENMLDWKGGHDELAAQLAAVTAERDELRIGKGYWQNVAEGVRAELHDAKCRIADLEADDGPGGNEHQTVVFERNQLRDENAQLCAKLADVERCNSHASDACDAYASENRQLRLTVHNLKAVAHAIVDAVAKENP